MRRSFITLLMSLLLGVFSLQAADTDLSSLTNALYVNGATVNTGATATLSLQMKNATAATISGFQGTVTLPSGASYVANSAAVSSSRATTSNFALSVKGTTKLGVICYSASSATFSGTSGEVATFKITAPSTPGTYTVAVSGIVLTTKLGVETEVSTTINTTLTVVQKVTGITLNSTELSLTKGKTSTLTATIAPTNASNKGVTWSSSNTNVATVSTSGVVTAVASGTATITCKAKDGSNKTATCTVTVSNPVTSITMNKTTLALTKGKTETLSVTYAPTDADSRSVTWKSSNTAAATVSTAGVVTAVATGSATITATSANGKTATCTVTVSNPVTSITMNKTTLALTKGKTETLSVTYAPTDADSRSVTWKSSNTAAATVSTAGVVTAVATGSATITATSANGKTATCTVTVTNPVTSITMNKTTLALTKGKTETLSVTYAPTDADSRSVTWKSSNEAAATVSTAGVVTAVATGSATITATSANGKTATCAVSVTTPVSNVTISTATDTIEVGSTITLTARTNADADNKGITWSTSDEAIATVSNTGVVTAIGCGTATITASSAADATKTAKCEILVNNVCINGIYYKVLSEEEKTIAVTNAATDVVSYSGDVVIPAKVNLKGKEYQVTVIGRSAFSNCTELNSIVIPTSIVSIRNLAFYQCSGISQLSIPSSVNYIGVSAFMRCSNLKKVIFDSTNFDQWAFSGCTSLETIICNTASVSTIHYSVFYQVPTNTCVLKVPYGSLSAYRNADNWKDFATITSIEGYAEKVTLNKTEAAILPYQTTALTATTDVADMTVTWISSDETIATVNNGVVTAKKSGTVTITATANDAAKVSASCTVTVGTPSAPANVELVDLGLPSGTLWANMNVGASVPEENGGYYSWGEVQEKESYTWANYKWCNGTNTTITKYCTDAQYGEVDNLTTLEKEDDAAFVNWGEDWRIPTREQMNELILNCTFTQAQTQSGESGYIVKGKNGEEIFLPAVGYKSGTNKGTTVSDYWASSLTDISPRAGRLLLNANPSRDSHEQRHYGFAVRPVSVNHAIRVSLDQTSATLTMGENLQLSATITPANTVDKSVTWSSSDESIVTVSASGVVTAKGNGKVTITATSVVDPTQSATCEITTSNICVDGMYYEILSEENKTAAVTFATTDYNSYSGEVVIPSKVTIGDNEYSVTEIKEYAFYKCVELASLTVPSSIVRIGNHAFSYCKSSVFKAVYISDLASWCNMTIGGVNESCPLAVAHNLYLNGELVTDLVITSEIPIVKYRTFQGCTSLQSLTIDTNAGKAFMSCVGLKTIVIGEHAIINNVNGSDTFEGCSGVQDVYIHCNIWTPTAQFCQGSSATIHVYSDKLSEYQNNSPWSKFTLTDDFNNPSAGSLSTIVGTNPTALKVSGDLNGTDIKYLRSLINDHSLTSLDMSGANIVAGGEAYYGSYTTENNVFPRSCFNECSNLKSIQLPSSVTNIAMFALSGTGVESITIPASVSGIEHGIVMKSTSVSNIYVEEGNQNYISVGGILYTKNNETLHTCPPAKSGDIVVLDGTSVLGARAFNNVKNVSSIVLPTSMTTINGSCFDGSQIETLVCNSTTPPVANASDPFASIHSSCVLKVPYSSLSAYRTADYWKDFATITSIEGYAEEIALDKSEGILLPTKTLTLTATTDKEGSEVTWSSSDESVATVENGVVTALKGGNVTITATTAGSLLTADCTLHVHGLDATEAKEATCTEVGNTAYWYCALCEKYFADADAQTETTLDATVVAAKGHTFVYTSNNDGATHTITCQYCDYEQSEDCTDQDGICSVCGGTLYVPGDSNGDNRINVGDLTSIASYIMGNTPANFVVGGADANKDGRINVGDLTYIAHLIMSSTSSAAPRQSSTRTDETTFTLAEATVQPGGQTTLTVGIEQTNTFSGFQFDVTLPEGVALEGVTMNGRNEGLVENLDFAQIADDQYRVLGYSLRGKALNGIDLLSLILRAEVGALAGDYSIAVAEAYVSDAETATSVADAMGMLRVVEPSSISALMAQGSPVTVYNSTGHLLTKDASANRLQDLTAGIYIINGQKIIIK